MLRPFRIHVVAMMLALAPAAAVADKIVGTEWHLLAIDGVIFEAEASLRFEADGMVGGKAPCNQWSVVNGATLPDLSLAAIRATRMACDRLPEEQGFFAALSTMTLAAQQDGEGPLILTNADGHSMEFVFDRGVKDLICTTCDQPD